jgi:hypothetical protein
MPSQKISSPSIMMSPMLTPLYGPEIVRIGKHPPFAGVSGMATVSSDHCDATVDDFERVTLETQSWRQ